MPGLGWRRRPGAGTLDHCGLARRAGLPAFYTEPCREVAFLLTIVAFIVALDARYLGRQAFPIGVAALATNALVTVLLPASWRRTEFIYPAVFHVVAATYLVLFSTGNNDPAMAYVLGLAAIIESLLLWLGSLLCACAGSPIVLGCAPPLGHCAVFMTGLAVLLCAHSPLTMALVSLSFLLAVKSLPRAEWLYGSIAALTVACYWTWFENWSGPPLVGLVLLAAFGLWIIAVLVQRHKRAICDLFGLSPLAHEYPFFHAAMVASVGAVWLRLNLSLFGTVAWTAHPWLPLGLCLLCMLFVRAYPSRLFIHAGLLFLSWSIVALVAPALDSACVIAAAGGGLALAFLAFERVLRPIEPAPCQCAGVVDVGFAQVLFGWAWTIVGISACLAIAILVDQIFAAVFRPGTAVLAVSHWDWWAMLLAIALLGAFVVAAAGDPDGSWPCEQEHLVIGFHWVAVCFVWWLGVVSSPLAASTLTAGTFYPLATAMAALATAQIVGRLTFPDGWNEAHRMPDLRSERCTRLFSVQASSLAILAVLFTRASTTPATSISSVIAALALALVALRTGWAAVAVAGGAACEFACAIAGLLVASWLDRTGQGPRSIYAAAGLLAGAFLLWHLAGTLRRDLSGGKGRFALRSWRNDLIPVGLALAIEWAAFASALGATAAALFAGSQPGLLWEYERASGVGLVIAAAALLVLFVPRWQQQGLVYLAQAVIVAAYVDFRMAYPWPIAADAVVLTLLGYLDLGLAELLERQKHARYAQSVRYSSLVLPVLPLLQLIWVGGTKEVVLFHLLAVATFYSVACDRCAGSRSATPRPSSTMRRCGCSGASSAGSSLIISSSSWCRSVSQRSCLPNRSATTWGGRPSTRFARRGCS